jgi:hypothetical protein
MELTRAVANICLVERYELLGELVELVKVVGRVRDLIRAESQPSDHLLNGSKVNFLFRLGVRIVESQIASMFSKSSHRFRGWRAYHNPP